MRRKTMFYQRFFNWIKGSVIIDFSTEHNLTSILPLFFSIWRTAPLTAGVREAPFLQLFDIVLNKRSGIKISMKLLYLGHEKLIFCFSGTLFKNEWEKANFFLLCQIIFFLFPSRKQCETLCDFINIVLKKKIIFENRTMKYSSNVL